MPLSRKLSAPTILDYGRTFPTPEHQGPDLWRRLLGGLFLELIIVTFRIAFWVKGLGPDESDEMQRGPGARVVPSRGQAFDEAMKKAAAKGPSRVF